MNKAATQSNGSAKYIISFRDKIKAANSSIVSVLDFFTAYTYFEVKSRRVLDEMFCSLCFFSSMHSDSKIYVLRSLLPNHVMIANLFVRQTRSSKVQEPNGMLVVISRLLVGKSRVKVVSARAF